MNKFTFEELSGSSNPSVEYAEWALGYYLKNKLRNNK